jgi:hypothetical protein
MSLGLHRNLRHSVPFVEQAPRLWVDRKQPLPDKAQKRLLSSIGWCSFKRNESIDVKRPLPFLTHANLSNNSDRHHLVYPETQLYGCGRGCQVNFRTIDEASLAEFTTLPHPGGVSLAPSTLGVASSELALSHFKGPFSPQTPLTPLTPVQKPIPQPLHARLPIPT